MSSHNVDSALSTLARLWPATLLAGVVAAAVVIAVAFRVEDGSLVERSEVRQQAQTSVLLDTARYEHFREGELSSVFRARYFSAIMASPDVRDAIADAAGVSPRRLTLEAPLFAHVLREQREQDALRRTKALQKAPIHISFVSQTDSPVIEVTAQAGSVAEAERVADAAVAGTQDYLTQTQREAGIAPKKRIVLRSLGHAIGGEVSTASSKALAAIAGLAVFLVGCLIIIALADSRRARREG